MAHNLGLCRQVIQKAIAAGAKALFLPEASDYIAGSAAETVSLVKSVQESEFVLGIQEEARRAKLPINVGVHEPTSGGQRVKNTLLWIDEAGEIVQRYQKLHLFDVEVEGGPIMRESDSVEPGNSILPPLNTPVGRVGLTICFDLRFPEISLALKRQNAQIITFPSAFTVPTGKAHWETLLRGRAIETQTYVLAGAQVGYHNQKRVSYGHSMIVSPWGEVLAELGGEDKGPEIITADIDLDEVQRIKILMPLLRRTDVYPEV
ncbi:putative nitrilase [Viridothelium virens]|uniref:Putative nitrilase n=1 Tax=Viridothelium virens TaxID=1048519 RepID=A0A6A6H9Q1_VIRVR|nr:putative nitrilase [Viridothelium virens]